MHSHEQSSGRVETHTQAADPLLTRRRDTGAMLRRTGGYSRAVGVLRWLLPVLVAVIMALIILWPLLNSQKITQTVAENIPNLVIENLNYSGVDSQNQPYAVQAARATQVPGDKSLVDLVQPRADLSLNNGAWVAGRADQGRFDQKANLLWLNGAVEFFHDQGYQMVTPEAQFDLQKNTARGDKPVLIHGGFGQITGEGFEIHDKGKLVIVNGHAKAVLNLRHMPGATAVKTSDEEP